MKKIKYIMMIAGFAVMGCSQNQEIYPCSLDYKAIEITNNCEELKEYIYQDIDNDALLGDVAETYIALLNEIIELNGYDANYDSAAID